MPLIRWSEKFAMGVPVFDEQHRRLVEMLNQLFDVASSGQGAAAILKLRQRLLQYAASHLRDEEAALREAGYPDIAQYKAEHIRYSTRIRELQSEVPDAATTRRLMRFLKEWWLSHIQESNTDCAEYLAHLVQTQ